MKNVSPAREYIDVDAEKTRVDGYLDFSVRYVSLLFLVIVFNVLIFGLIH